MRAPRLPYRIVTGEMGQLLTDKQLMQCVPVPQCPTWIYAGTGGARPRFCLIGNEPNDGVLKVSKTRRAGVRLVLVPAMHAFLMNSRVVVRDLVAPAAVLAGLPPVP